MPTSLTRYTIRIEGRLPECWQEWFDGLAVANLANGQAVLQGCLPDQSALVGVINQLHNLNLILISATRESPEG